MKGHADKDVKFGEGAVRADEIQGGTFDVRRRGGLDPGMWQITESACAIQGGHALLFQVDGIPCNAPGR